MATTLTRPRLRVAGGPPGEPGRLGYALAAGAFLVLVSVLAWRNNIISDFGQHASAIERIKADPLRPANPLLDLPGTDCPYYSPLIVLLGLIARVTGWAGRTVLRGCGVANLLLLVTGIASFTRVLTRRPAAPLLALAATMLLWGVRPAAWSGFLSLSSLTRNVSFPSAFTVALALHLWALTARAARNRTSYPVHVLIGLGMALIVLTHPITSVGAGVGVAAFVAGWQRPWDRAALLRWGATLAVAAAAMAAWPYYDVFRLLGNDTVDGFHRALYGVHLLTWYGLALAGVPALVMRFRRHRADPLVLIWAADLLIAAYGWFSGHYTYGRIFGVALFPPQFALAVELARHPRRWGPRRRWLAAVAALAAAGGLLVQVCALIPLHLKVPVVDRGLTYLVTWPSYQWAADRIRVGDVVLTDDSMAEHVLPAYGAFLVSGAWPDPSLSAALRHRRAEDVAHYFAPDATPAEQRRIAAGYHVRWVLLSPGQPLPAGATPVATGSTGERLARLG